MRPRTVVAAFAVGAGVMLSQVEAQAVLQSNQAVSDSSAVPMVLVANSDPMIESYICAAETGDLEGTHSLGVPYGGGRIEPRDYSSALYWYMKSTNRGSTRAMSNVALMYFNSLGAAQDGSAPAAWLEPATIIGGVRQLDNFPAMADVEFEAGPDPKLAYAVFRKAAESGSAAAMLRVGDDYARGDGVNEDLVQAYAWLETSLLTGVPPMFRGSVLTELEYLAFELGLHERDQAELLAAHFAAAANVRALSFRGDFDQAACSTSPTIDVSNKGAVTARCTSFGSTTPPICSGPD